MYTYPHTIENGTGEHLTFVRRVQDADGEYVEVENYLLPNAGPPMHVHYKQSEGLTIVQGRMGVQVPGKEPEFYTEGQSVSFQAGEPHRFWNAGTEPLVCRGWVRPVHNIEYFLTEIYRTTRENGGHRPGAFEGAYLSWRYRSEFGMTEIPSLVRSVVFPATVAIGTLLGKYRKYRDAPEPIR